MATTVQKINKTTFGNLALRGYDPVAYFAEGRPLEGRKRFTHHYADATWRFTTSRIGISLHKTLRNTRRNLEGTVPGESVRPSSSMAIQRSGRSSTGNSM